MFIILKYVLRKDHFTLKILGLKKLVTLNTICYPELDLGTAKEY